MSPRRPLWLFAAALCFVAAAASMELGVWAPWEAAAMADASEELRDELPDEGPLMLGSDSGPTLASGGASCAVASHAGIRPRRGHLPDVHRPPEA